MPAEKDREDRFGDHRGALLTRRLFLALTGAAVTVPASMWAKDTDTVPANLDHILLGISDLERGIAWVEQRTGVRAVFGGVHPGRGTQNALLSLGPRRYLEIIAPDPKQPLQSEGPAQPLASMHEPHLFNWAVHTDDIAAAAKRAVAAGFAIDGPADGSRTRPDGKALRWKACRLKDDRGGLLPFFIQWERDSVHPSEDAPAGCVLKRFALQSAQTQELEKLCQGLGVDASIEHGNKPLLRALISSNKGNVQL
jgi:Glyoxalase-like domain